MIVTGTASSKTSVISDTQTQTRNLQENLRVYDPTTDRQLQEINDKLSQLLELLTLALED